MGIDSRLTDDEVKLVKEAYVQTQKQREYATKQASYENCQEAASPRSKPASPFNEIDSATAAVGDLANRIGRLAALLCGDFPSSCDAAGNPSRPGFLGQVADRAGNLMAAVQSSHEALSRIEQQLP